MNNKMEAETPLVFKRMIMAISGILMLIGLPLSANLLCAMSSSYFQYSEMLYSVFSCLAVLLTMGVGIAAFIHSNGSIQKKRSKILSMPPIPLLVGAFGLLLFLGLFFFNANISEGLFFPPILIVLAALPPLWSVAWFARTDTMADLSTDEPILPTDNVITEETKVDVTDDANKNHITWRRGVMAFIGGATIGVLVALILEIILPAIVLALVFDLANVVLDSVRALFEQLAGFDIANALTNPGFIYVFILLAVIAPLAEEIAKPLALLPILRRLNRKQAFLMGALAGAGFAAIENVIYAASSYELWSGVLLIRSLGGALHPLGAGLMALAWRDVLCEEQGAWSNWLKRFAIAVGVHAVWNGGSLLVITFGGAGLFGELPAEIGTLGISAAGVTLAFLILLGISALWIGRIFGHGESPESFLEDKNTDVSLAPSERTLAIWALACLTAIVPIGIAGLSLWLR
ncbi:MAG: PrsW family intramembrane metalloprotease [Anaerolineales bacterium]|nr:PrsW family intramembrane metalloprotease [Anaerolineales bacterium]